MIREELKLSIADLVENERASAAEIWGKTNASDHESYALIKEEYEETVEELENCELTLQEFWSLIREDAKGLEKEWALQRLKKTCYSLIAEAIQLCGSTEKALYTIFERRAKGDVD